MTNEIPVEGFYLENHQGTSNKFYTILAAGDGTLVFAWGRIGQKGQHKIQHLAPSNSAWDAAEKQMRSKMGRGYERAEGSSRFTVNPSLLITCRTDGDAGPLLREFYRSREAPIFAQASATTMSQYDSFVDTAQELLENAHTLPFDDVYAKFEELDETWKELEAKHATAQTAVNIVQQILQQRLMSGDLTGAK